MPHWCPWFFPGFPGFSMSSGVRSQGDMTIMSLLVPLEGADLLLWACFDTRTVWWLLDVQDTTHIHIYIYIYIHTHTIYIYIYGNTYIYIYILIARERERECTLGSFLKAFRCFLCKSAKIIRSVLPRCVTIDVTLFSHWLVDYWID